MDQKDSLPQAVPDDLPSPRRGRSRLRALGLLVALLTIGLLGLWLVREDLAHRVIASQLRQYDLPMTYRIEAIGPQREVLRDVVVGDPRRPDFTAERVEVWLQPRLGVPTVGKVTLTRPRLYGTLRNGALSFGHLDRVLFDSSRPSRGGLPDLNLVLDDGRARIDSDFGTLGIKAAGTGNLRNGFAGMIAAVSPDVDTHGCNAKNSSLFGELTTQRGVVRFKGPLRAATLGCGGLAMRRVVVALDGTISQGFDAVRTKAALSTGLARIEQQQITTLQGGGEFSWRDNMLTAQYRLAGIGLTGGVAAQELVAEGLVRTREGFAQIASEGKLTGQGIRPGAGLDRSLAWMETQAGGTLAAPLIAQMRRGLQREGANSTMQADYTLRRTGDLTSLVVPRATVRGASGATLIAGSRLQTILGGGGGPRVSGNIITGGQGLPQLSGQIERQSGGKLIGRFVMAEYSAGGARLALPELVVVQRPDGAIGFAGRVIMSGALPGGRAERLALPLDGNWSSRDGLAFGRGCQTIAFEKLAYANLTLDRRSLLLCPGPGGAMVRSGPGGTRIAVGAPSLTVSGRLGQTPIRIASGPVGFAMPGTLVARKLDVALGTGENVSRFQIANLDARVGKEIAGQFSGSDIRLINVPLDLIGANGRWRYANGKLTLSDGAFRLLDRQPDGRFKPMVSRNATLTLADNRIVASTLLREPESDRAVVQTYIVHDLVSGRGYADLNVPGIVFDQRLQPVQLTNLVLGVVANTKGVVTGTGRIDWNGRGVTSRGQFSTDSLDFAAAFGPASGVSGTVVFDDLLGMVTAPNQQLKIGTMNPGIEVNDGILSFALEPEQRLRINGIHWNFLDGELILLPTAMQFGRAETRRFTLKVVGLNAAKFVQKLELANINATGIFDGELPLVFDDSGGSIQGGKLVSRPPGGNLSYIGELTYRDLSPMGNYAFQALRSLDFRRMEIAMDGALDGEIMTRIRTEGVRQGALAKRNFITRRFEKVPIKFNINIRAPFQRLLRSMRSLYDDRYVTDPRELGLVDAQGKRIVPPSGDASPAIQTPASRNVP